MSNQSKLGLGRIITNEQQRDAIHIAVAPVIAAHTLIAGRHVAFDKNGNASEHTDNPPIGVIDPFLDCKVEKGQQCWLFLYPGTITGLRHEWYHPAFAAVTTSAPSASEKWLRHFAEQVDADYDEMMAIASTHCDEGDKWGGDYLNEGGKWEGQGTPDEFWTHFTAVTGKTGSGGIFSCSC